MISKMLKLDIDNNIEKLKEILSDGYIYMMYECFVLTMNKSNHTSISNLKPYISPNNILTSGCGLSWVKSIDEKIIRTQKNQNQTTDFATMLISLGLLDTIEIIKKDCGIENIWFETSVTGTGIDFWISDKSQPLNFKARIEISGIKSETQTNTLKYRAGRKSKQVLKSANSLLPVYISLIEFSQLQALILKK